jgi:hypothetical protein
VAIAVEGVDIIHTDRRSSFHTSVVEMTRGDVNNVVNTPTIGVSQR